MLITGLLRYIAVRCAEVVIAAVRGQPLGKSVSDSRSVASFLRLLTAEETTTLSRCSRGVERPFLIDSIRFRRVVGEDWIRGTAIVANTPAFEARPSTSPRTEVRCK